MAGPLAPYGRYLARGVTETATTVLDIVDVLGPGRDVLDQNQADILAAALKKAAAGRCTEIRLGGKSFTAEAARVVAPVLASMTQLTRVDISDVIASRPEEEGLEVLRTLSSALLPSKATLSVLNLSDNALGEKGIRACGELLDRFEGLRELYLCNNGLSAEACTLISDVLLFRGEEAVVPLTVFEFHDNMCGDQGGVNLARLVARLANIRSFRFSKTRCGREGCEAIAEALGTCISLTHANFEDITFGAEGSRRLARSLKKCPDLIHLNVRDAMLEEEGAAELLEVLRDSAPKLSFLDMSGNDLTSESIETVIAALKDKVHLTYLGLDDNEIGNGGALELAKALGAGEGFPALTTLSCKSCDLTDAGAKILLRGAMVKPLQRVLLDGNGISETALEVCAALLEGKGGMEVLGDLEDNDVDVEEDEDEEDVQAIRAFDLAQFAGPQVAEVDDLASMLERAYV